MLSFQCTQFFFNKIYFLHLLIALPILLHTNVRHSICNVDSLRILNFTVLYLNYTVVMPNDLLLGAIKYKNVLVTKKNALAFLMYTPVTCLWFGSVWSLIKLHMYMVTSISVHVNYSIWCSSTWFRSLRERERKTLLVVQRSSSTPLWWTFTTCCSWNIYDRSFFISICICKKYNHTFRNTRKYSFEIILVIKRTVDYCICIDLKVLIVY